MRILLVHPPVYDFTVHDFWLKPYGLLRVAGYLRGKAEFELFDFLDRQHPFMKERKLRSDDWGRGEFHSETIQKPAIFREVPRYYRRFGLPRELFRDFLQRSQKFDFALLQTGMTYWYQGVQEVIEELRKFSPDTRIVLGGPYASLCPQHAQRLEADLVVKGIELEPVWNLLGVEPCQDEPALWESYTTLRTGVVKLTDGCPMRCTYCSVPKLYGGFRLRSLQRAMAEAELLQKLSAEHIAFYDDALLFRAEELLIPFLQKAKSVRFHTPNGLHSKYLTPEVARAMVEGGVESFFIGFESVSERWQARTGGKLSRHEFVQAVHSLIEAGAPPRHITAYIILGHPRWTTQQLEESMRFVNGLGIRIMLADFAPVPGTPDAELCREWIELDEPLFHNKTAFPILMLGAERVNSLKNLCRALNRSLPP